MQGSHDFFNLMGVGTVPLLLSICCTICHGIGQAADFRWGTYHPGLYYGIRSRTNPHHVSAGLLWLSSNDPAHRLRHECTQGDGLKQYGWLQHNGRNFGLQRIYDEQNDVALETIFLKPPIEHDKFASQSWASRITARSLHNKLNDESPETASMFFYIDIGCEDDGLNHPCRKELTQSLQWRVHDTSICKHQPFNGMSCMEMQIISDHSISIWKFTATIQVHFDGPSSAVTMRFWGDTAVNIVNVKEKLMQWGNEHTKPDHNWEIELNDNVVDKSSIVVVQVKYSPRLTSNVVLHVLYEEVPEKAVTPIVVYDDIISKLSRDFELKFESSFRLSGSLHGALLEQNYLATAEAAFSSLLGGIGFSYGRTLLQKHGQIKETASKALLSAVPSRSFFPRGFLWDEGFHQLGIVAFDPDITAEVLDHWFQLMEPSGYIARALAQNRVPAEFLVQNAEHANPPTLLLCVEKLLKFGHHTEQLRTWWPLLQKWFHWYQESQAGQHAYTFRWRGRMYDGKLMPNTLASGLDDYPRASEPSDDERHVDLLCWMTKASDILSQVALLVKDYDMATRYTEFKQSYLKALDTYHWHENLYLDYGMDSNDGTFEEHIVIRCQDSQRQTFDATASLSTLQAGLQGCPKSHPQYLYPLGDGKGGLLKKEVFNPRTVQLQFVKHIGYVSFFPLFLKLVPVDSPKLDLLLDALKEHLMTPFGLRSLSPMDNYYDRPNAPGDAPYWRGAIWINMNYLAVDSFQYYAKRCHNPKTQEKFETMYQELRQALIGTIFGEYAKSGYFYEQYNQVTGKGQRCHPFTGWTSLVVNILAEIY